MRILIIRLSSLGDVVLTQPIGEILKKKYPQAEIDYLTKAEYYELVQAFGYVNVIYKWEKGKKFALLKEIRRINYDLVVDLQAKFNTFIIKTFLKANRIITYQKKHLLRVLIVKKLTRKRINSTLDLYFSVFKKLGIRIEKADPVLIPQNVVTDFKIDKTKNYLAIFPGATHKTKQYPVKKIIEFINLFSSEREVEFILLGSRNERNLSDLIEKSTLPKTQNLCGELDISQLINVLDKVDFVLSNDSGPMHIAAALKKKQIGIFGSTHTKLGFRPLNDNAQVIELNLPCQPCTLHGLTKCPKGHYACMNFISTDLIFKKYNDMRGN